jgi:hypothetical protein
MDTNKKGNIGLIKVIDNLVENGYFPFLPFSDTTVVDLILSNEKMELKKFQVKYKKLEKNSTCINLTTQRVVDRKKVDTDLSLFDYYAVYCPNNNKIYYVPTNVFENKKMITLRVVPAKQKQKKVIDASQYELIPKW